LPAPGAGNVTRDQLVDLYRWMLLTRRVEEVGHTLYKQGRIPGSFYTGRGNEAASVGIAAALEPEDVAIPLHRNLGVHLMRGTEPWRILANYLGRVDGPARGRDGNIHFADFDRGQIAIVSHLPAMAPVAVGCALAFRIRQEPRVAVVWFGDGSSARSDVHEAMNLAGVRRLPVVFVCDNNQFAYSTPTHLNYACERLADRARAYGFDGVQVDGTDVLSVHDAATTAVERARDGGGPTLIESVTLRMEGHAVHDDAFYVPRELLRAWAESDPLERYRSWLRAEKGFADDEEAALREEITRIVNDAVRRAEESPFPDPAEVATGVYAG
jgi:TPP-dependent pyruvate/acetoin dehydrogenase alpha subunit